MKINVVDMEEIENYMRDLYHHNDKVFKDAKEIVDTFKNVYGINNTTIESYTFSDYINSKYNEDIKYSITLLKYAIRDTQSRKEYKILWQKI